MADNAHKQYIKSRVAPSADAIKRSRNYTATLLPHPSLSWLPSNTVLCINFELLGVLLPGGTEKDSMLKSIKGYRPQQVSGHTSNPPFLFSFIRPYLKLLHLALKVLQSK